MDLTDRLLDTLGRLAGLPRLAIRNDRRRTLREIAARMHYLGASLVLTILNASETLATDSCAVIGISTEGRTMHHTIRRSLAITLLATPAVAGAQAGPRPAEAQEMIPRELAIALLSNSPGMTANDLRVGKAPDDVPPELVPPGLQVLGSMTQFENSIIVFAAPQPPDSAIALIEAALLGSGWTRPPAQQVRPRNGFVAANDFFSSYDRPQMVCHGDAFATFTSAYRRSGGSILKVSYNRGARFSACKAQPDPSTYRSPFDDAPMPTLRAPEGSMTSPTNNGMSGSSNGVTVSTQLSTKLKPAEVVAHYDKQMIAAGWTSLSDGAADNVAVHNYRKKDEKDRAWTATLLSMVVPEGTEQAVSLRLSRR